MKPLFTALSLLAFASCASTSMAQESSPTAATSAAPRPIQASYSFKTENPAAYVAALDQFMSACGKGLTMSLFANVFDGSDEATHTAIFTFADPRQFNTLSQTQTCPGSAPFRSTASVLGDAESSTMGMVVMAGGDPAKDQAFQVVQMKMKAADEATYVAAFDEFIKASPPAGSYGVVRIIGGSNADYTHYVYLGNKSIGDIAYGMASQPGQSAATQKFNRKVESLRTIISRTMFGRVKDYNAAQ